MNIHAHFICWNEEKILPYFLRHYESICSKIFIYDNGSTDKTLDILSRSNKVVIKNFYSNDTSDELTEVYVKANSWKNSIVEADWVIVGDMDEFIYSSDLHSKLKEYDNRGITALQPYAYQMVSMNFPSTHGQIYEEVNKGVRFPFYDKIQVFNAKKVRDIVYAPGCHAAYIETNGLIHKTEQVKLLHFKMMGARQVYERHQILHNRRSPSDIKNRYGVHYSKSYEEIKTEIEELWMHSISLV